MRNDTRVLFNAYLHQLATLNSLDISAISSKFTATPSVQQKLESRMQESSQFLRSINIFPVNELKGEKIGIGVSGTIAGRTDTSSSGERSTRDVSALTDTGYECKKTDYDTHITYAKLDAWAKFPNFQILLRDAILQRCALDRMMIGFNGTSAAATTNRGTNPLLQDVNIGWLQKIRTDAASHVMDEGAVTGKVTYGVSADYKNLDALVFDALNTLVEPWHRQDTQMVAIVGRSLMHDKLFPIVNNNDAPTERLAADIIMSQMRLGGLPAVQVPYFPDDAIAITRLDNLSIYYQEGGRRRAVVDNPKRDRIENYESSNDAFVVEDYDMVALVENIEEKTS